MTSRFFPAVLFASLAAAGSLASSPSLAQPSAADRTLAEALFRDAKTLFGAGKVPEACAKFSESMQIDPRLGTLLHLATCHEQEGKTATAWGEFTDAAGQAANAHQADREKIARDRIRVLEAKLSRVTITAASAVDGLEIKLDGKALGHAAIGTPVPVDPGEHSVQASAPGRKPWSTKIDVGQGPLLVQLAVPALEADALAPPPPKVEPPKSPPPPAPAPSNDRRTWGFVVGGVGVLGVAAGTFFGVSVLSKKSDAEKECAGRLCTQRGLDLYDEARTASTLSTIGFAVGVVGLGAGAYLLLTSSKERPAQQAVRVLPSVGAGSGGVQVSGAW